VINEGNFFQAFNRLFTDDRMLLFLLRKSAFLLLATSHLPIDVTSGRCRLCTAGRPLLVDSWSSFALVTVARTPEMKIRKVIDGPNKYRSLAGPKFFARSPIFLTLGEQ